MNPLAIQTLLGEEHLESEHEIQACPHAAAMSAGFTRLRFADELETAFRAWYWRQHRDRVRLATLLGALLFCVFALKDVRTLPQDIYAWTAGLRIGLIVPAVLAMAALTYRKCGEEVLEFWVMVGSLIAMIGLGAVVLIAEALGGRVPYEGLMLVAFFVFFVSGLRAYKATACVVSAVIVFAAGQVYAGVEPAVIALRTLYLATNCAIGLVGAYTLEYNARRRFLTEGLARFRAERDHLTMLPNRRALFEHLRLVWRSARRDRCKVGLFMIDIDHFKSYNDDYGHVVGDGCLSRVASALEHTLGRPLDIVGRFGGEEFLGVAYDIDERALAKLGERLRAAVIALDIEHTASPCGRVSVSVGGTLADPADSSPPSASVRAADDALYAAKRSGRDQVRCDAPGTATLQSVGGRG